MILVSRPLHANLKCFVDPKGDVNTNSFIAQRLAQEATVDECNDLLCHDALGRPSRRNVWSCPNRFVEELLANRTVLKLKFDLFVKDKNATDPIAPPQFAYCLEEGETPEDVIRKMLADPSFLPSAESAITELPLTADHFAALVATVRPRPPSRTSPLKFPQKPPPRWRRRGDR